MARTGLWQAGPVLGFDRATALGQLASQEFDVLVIGGGITGAGVALDAASRGLRTALVERRDFASGTSSKSSKLVHGGLRYLQQREIRLVYESLAERQRLLENAPHLVSQLPFLIPLFGRNGVAQRAVVRSFATALWLYDLTGGWRIGSRHRRVGRAEALEHHPLLRADNLVSGFLYYDARADDARLTLAVLRTAALEYGAVVANYAQVGRLLAKTGRVIGAAVRPVRGSGLPTTPEDEIEVRAHAVVNATGVWADDVRALDDAPHRTLRPAKGVHVTVPAASLPCDIAAVIPVRGDRRSIFVIPWPDCAMTYVGTTDTAYDGPLDDPACTADDVDYLLSAVNGATSAGLTRADVTGVWAGLRPLLAPANARLSERTADLSRRHSVETSPSGLVTVTGGKLTTYRKMAEDAVDEVVRLLRSANRIGSALPSSTKRLRLRGACAPTQEQLCAYGTEAATVLAVADGRPELLEPVVEGLPFIGAEVVYAARAEMAQTVADVLERRTRALLQHAHKSMLAAPAVARLLAPELGWADGQADAEVESFINSAQAQLELAGLPSPSRDRR